MVLDRAVVAAENEAVHVNAPVTHEQYAAALWTSRVRDGLGRREIEAVGHRVEPVESVAGSWVE